MAVTVISKGSFKNTLKFLRTASNLRIEHALHKYGKMGVDALSAATPVDTGKTAASWGYSIEYDNNSVKLIWTNDNVNNYVNIAIILQYGHATGTGGWVEGIDYINPALAPVFEEISKKLWKEVIEE